MAERMAYYHAHEREYVKRLRTGHSNWDAGAYDDFHMRPFVLRMLSASKLDRCGGRALELGCGTGPLACLLTEAGLETVAVDVSPSAIRYAQQQSMRRNLRIDFQVRDVVRECLPQAPFDVIVDSHLLHCLVPLDERAMVLKAAREALAPDGEFWTETMAMTPSVQPDPAWHLDAEGITWMSLKQPGLYAEEVQRDGQAWLPTRRVRKVVAVLEELSQAGFHVLHHEVEERPQPHATVILRARCGR